MIHRLHPLALALLFALGAPALADDVFLVPGSTIKTTGNRIRGTVQSETPTEVKVGSQAVPVDQIDRIHYDGQPASMTLAETREGTGALPEAAELYQKAAADAADKPFVAQAALFRRAEILAEIAQGDPSRAGQATEALEAVIKAGSKGRHLGPALEALAKLQISKGDFDQAARTLAQLNQVPWAADRAAVLQSRVLARKGEYDKAVAALDRLLAKAPEGSARHREATLARAECLAGMKKFDQAEAAVRSVIKAAPPEDAEVQALAHNTLGDCLRAAGKPKDALYAYLHTDILYDKDKEQRARALAQIAQLWRELKRDDFAEAAMERLKQDYPNSPYAQASAKR